MSLSKILAAPDTKARLKGLIVRPPLAPLPQLVPVRGENPARVGTAFDYALRFGLTARGWGTQQVLIADVALRKMPQSLLLTARRKISDSKATIQQANLLGPLSGEAASACFALAGIDVVHRAGFTDQVERPTSPAEVTDLQELWSLVPWEEFRPKSKMLLNPNLGQGSVLMRGADPDLVVDDAIVDIKTQADNRMTIEPTRQLVAYALLANRFGFNGAPANSGSNITRVGVYFSRAGKLVDFALNTICAPKDQEQVLHVLLTAAKAC